MRTLLLTLVLIAAPFSAAAQAPEPPAATAPEAPPNSHAEARSFLHALIAESGILPAAIEQAWTEQARDLNRLYRSLPIAKANRDAAIAFLDSVPALLQEELETALPPALDAAAPRVAELMSAEELTALTAYLRSETGRAEMIAYVTNPNAADRSRAAFAKTPEGELMEARIGDLSALLNEVMTGVVHAVQPRIMHRVTVGLCTALADDCPRSLRDRIGPI